MSNKVCNQCNLISEAAINMNCEHSYCPKCLTQIIFNEHVHEFHLWDKLYVECTQKDKGNCSIEISEILQFLQKTIQTNSKFKPDTPCQFHSSRHTDVYCLDCNYYICELCVKDSPEHQDHKKLDTQEVIKYSKEILELITFLPLTLWNFNSFAERFQQIGESYRKSVEDEFNKTMRNIDEMINELKSFKLTYSKMMKQNAERNFQIMKILKLFYYIFYNNYENRTDLDIMTLINVKNIKNDFENIIVDTTNSHTLNETLKQIKAKVKEIVNEDQMTNLIQTTYKFREVSNEFMRTTTLLGHNKNINKIIQLQNGNLCTGSEDYSIRFWKDSDKSEKEIIKLDKLIGRVKDIIQLDDGRILFSQFDRNVVRVLDFDQSEEYVCNHELIGHSEYVTTILQIPNSRQIVTSSKDTNLVIWKMIEKSFEQKQVLHHKKSGVYSVCYTKNNEIVSGGNGGEMIVWTENDSKYSLNTTITAHSLRVTTLSPLFSNEFASGSYDCEIKIWKKNKESYECTFSSFAHNNGVSSIVQLHDKRLLSGGYDNLIKIWENTANQWIVQEKLIDMNEQVLCVCQLKDKRIAASGLSRAMIWRSRHLIDME